MHEPHPQITHVLLHVSQDLGHGGSASTYRIEPDGDGYQVTLSVSRPFPARGERASQPSAKTQALVKDKEQVEQFLHWLSTEFNVFELGDLKSPYPFLHPTFYSFSFRDAAGRDHSFSYQIECLNHLDARYQGLIEAFHSFFESRKAG